MSITDRIYRKASEALCKDPVVMVMGHTYQDLRREVCEAVTRYGNYEEARGSGVIRIGGFECYPLDIPGYGYVVGEREQMIQLQHDLKQASYARFVRYHDPI